MTRTYLARPLAVGVFAIAAMLYALTAYPTITWWDSASYSLSAATLGTGSPPGSLLLTLIGWPVAKLVAPTHVAQALNILAAMISASIVVLVFVDTTRLLRREGEEPTAAPAVGAFLGALLFASTTTLWSYAVRFTPYSLSALFTAILLFVLITWWQRADEPDAWILLVLVSFLFGVDFSVHRTNALMIPGALAWVLIRKPAEVLRPRAVVSCFAALCAGLLIQLLTIPIASRSGSPLNFANPNSFSRFWDYVTLQQLGGGFLLQLFPRKSAVWSTQIADVLGVLRDNFFSRSGRFGLLGVAPGVAAIVGAIALLRKNVKLGVALLALLFLQIAATVLYFNIPANYFRSFDRHYLPLCVTLGILTAAGFGAVLRWAVRANPPLLGFSVAVAMVAIPIARLPANYARHDASKRYFAHDWATNALTQLPPNAVYLTVGDNDTFPAMFVQAVEGVRRDVTIINTSIALLPEWRGRLRRTTPNFPLDSTTTTDSISYSTTFSRPVAYAVTGAAYLKWPMDSGRFEGLHWTLKPRGDRDADLALARRNPLESANYRGYADPAVQIDETTPDMAVNYHYAVLQLLHADRVKVGAEHCRADRETLFRLVPPNRIRLRSEVRSEIESICD